MSPTEIPPPPGTGLAWEEPSAGMGSIVPTVIRFITRPVDAYANMSHTVDLVRPIAYFVLLAILGACLSQLWSYLWFDSMIGFIRSLAGAQFDKFAPMIQRPGAIQLVLGLVITPLVALVVLFIWTALVHLSLTLFGGAHRGFATTLRVMCYAQTTQVAVAIPFLGGIIGFLWRLVLEMVGLAQAHRTDGWKAVLAVLLPLLLCCLCLVGGAVAFGAAVVQALQNLK